MKTTIDKEIKKKFLKEVKKQFDNYIGVSKDNYEDVISSGGRLKTKEFNFYQMCYIEFLLRNLDVNINEYYKGIYEMRKEFEEIKEDYEEIK